MSLLNQVRVITSGQWKRDTKQIFHNALAYCIILTRGENSFLICVTSSIHMAVRNSFTLSLEVSIDFMAGKSAAVT